MSDELLVATLEPLGYPVKPYEYKGAKAEYIVYNEEDERGTNYSDDLPTGNSIWWQVHLFTPSNSNYRSAKRRIRELLQKAGFGVGQVKTIYEKETETVHVIISCNYLENMEDEING